MDRQIELGGGRFDRGEQLEIVLELLDRRHEHAEPAVARLDRERGAHRTGFGCGGAAARRDRLRTAPAAAGGLARPSAAKARAIAAGSGSAPRSANGSAGTRCGSSIGSIWGSELSGSRKPTGESPGIRNSLPAAQSARLR